MKETSNITTHIVGYDKKNYFYSYMFVFDIHTEDD